MLKENTKENCEILMAKTVYNWCQYYYYSLKFCGGNRTGLGVRGIRDGKSVVSLDSD